MKILITGANGMLGTALCKTLKAHKHKILATDVLTDNDSESIERLDVINKDEIFRLSYEFRPDVIFHLAAKTDVDKCESQIEHAYLVNAIGTENVALVCQQLQVIMVYISTAAVFDGNKAEPYVESDHPNPVNIYGKTKLEGERAVERLLNKYFIIRAGWMIGGGKKDEKFVAKIVRLLKEKKEISVVNDKFGSPVFTKDLSECMANLLATGRFGLYHIANKGMCSRYDIACQIVKLMDKKDVTVKPVSSASFPLPAPRGRSEAMVNLKLKLLDLDTMRPWQEALKEYLNDYFK